MIREPRVAPAPKMVASPNLRPNLRAFPSFSAIRVCEVFRFGWTRNTLYTNESTACIRVRSFSNPRVADAVSEPSGSVKRRVFVDVSPGAIQQHMNMLPARFGSHASQGKLPDATQRNETQLHCTILYNATSLIEVSHENTAPLRHLSRDTLLVGINRVS